MAHVKAGSIAVEGLEVVLRRLEKMPEDIAKHVERYAFRKALKHVKDTADATVPRGSDLSSVAYKTRKGWKQLSDYENKITVKHIKKKFISGQVVNLAPHAHLVHNGHVMKDHKGNVTSRGSLATTPRPWFFDALKRNHAKVVQTLVDEVNKKIKSLETKGTL